MIEALLLFILSFVGAYFLVKRLPDSACTGDCRQGRDCNCVKK